MNKEEYTKWRDLIGDFMLKFSEVEAELYTIIYDFADPIELKNMLKVQFKDRVNYSIKLIDRMNIDSNLKRRLRRSINELMKLGESTRNLIAHNPLNLALESLFEERVYLEIRSYRNTNVSVTYDILKSRNKELCSWLDELKDGLSIARRILLPEDT